MNKLTLKIEPDDNLYNPCEDDNYGTLFCYHDRYQLGHKHEVPKTDFSTWEEVESFLRREMGAVVILPLYLYDHSGITMNTTGFHCPWDSGQVGVIYATRKSIELMQGWKRLNAERRAKVEQYLKNEVKHYDNYLRGDGYGYVIEDEDGEVVESCWGFYEKDYCIQEGSATLGFIAKKELEVRD